MPFVYKYVNHKTKEVEYVGIVKSDDGLEKRLLQHERDEWFCPMTYEIYYTHVETQTDAEALEAHFIALYESHKHHNKAKSKWGLLSFAPEVEWILYTDCRFIPTSSKAITDRYKRTRTRLWLLEEQIQSLRDEMNNIWNNLVNEEKEIEKFNRKSIRDFFRSKYTTTYRNDGEIIGVDRLFSEYEEWWEDNTDAAVFDDSNDFWETMLDMYDFRHCLGNDYIIGVVEKDYFTNMYKRRMLEEEAR